VNKLIHDLRGAINSVYFWSELSSRAGDDSAVPVAKRLTDTLNAAQSGNIDESDIMAAIDEANKLSHELMARHA
jgi:hypothetical protein